MCSTQPEPSEPPAKKHKNTENDVDLPHGTELNGKSAVKVVENDPEETGEDDDFDPGEEWEDGNDDETTLNEEEKKEETNENELIELQEEGDLPIEQLLARYGGYAPDDPTLASSSASTSAASAGSSRNSRRERRAQARSKIHEDEVEKSANQEAESNHVICDSSTNQEQPEEVLPCLEPSESSENSARGESRASLPESGLGADEQEMEMAGPSRAAEFGQDDASSQGSSSSDEVGVSGCVPHPEQPCSNSLTYMMQLTDEDEDSEDDTDYVPPEIWRKEPRVGPEFQFPADGLPNPSTREPSETTGDTLLWRPDLAEEKVEAYLRAFFELMQNWCEEVENSENSGTENAASNEQNGCPDLPEDLSAVLKDDDVALALLLQNNYNTASTLEKQSQLTKEAPRNFLENQFVLGTNPDARLSALETIYEKHRKADLQCNQVVCNEEEKALNEKIWTEERGDEFEEGLRRFGKNFSLIKKAYFPNRTTGELVQYYYAWKKTERHDMFVQKFRFEKQKFTHNPNATDFMENFMNQMDGIHNPVPAALTILHHQFPDLCRDTAAAGCLTPAVTSAASANQNHSPVAGVPFPGLSHTNFSGSSLISSDPKHALGQYHSSHFNEWQPQLLEGVMEEGARGAGAPTVAHVGVVCEQPGGLPHLDSEVVDEILKT